MSKKVNLADHLGHKVTVIGVITREGKGEEGEKGEESGEYADVRVTRLKMISTGCE